MSVHDGPAPTERKVIAAARGGGLAGATAGVIVWALGEYLFPGIVPGPVELFVYVAVPAAFAAAGARWAGWRARHTPRPDLELPPPGARHAR